MQGPDFSFEKKAWKKGFSMVIGVDEVGRGALAGPVVAAGVALKTNIIDSRPRVNNISYSKIGRSNLLKIILSLGINDSKKLSPEKRKFLAKIIKKYFYWGIGEGSVAEINKLGIVKATERAMRRALRRFAAQGKRLNGKIFVLADAFHIKYLKGIGLKNQLAIVKGDQKSISISAASIIAKVYRDKLMEKIASKYSKYGWEKNKGYGTDFHRKSILEYGITKLHRRKFVRFV